MSALRYSIKLQGIAMRSSKKSRDVTVYGSPNISSRSLHLRNVDITMNGKLSNPNKEMMMPVFQMISNAFSEISGTQYFTK